MKRGLQKCANFFLRRFYRKAYIGNTIEEDLEKLHLRNAYRCLGTEASHGIGHKNEKENVKTEYLVSLRLILYREFSAKRKNKIQATGSVAVTVTIIN